MHIVRGHASKIREVDEQIEHLSVRLIQDYIGLGLSRSLIGPENSRYPLNQ